MNEQEFQDELRNIMIEKMMQSKCDLLLPTKQRPSINELLRCYSAHRDDPICVKCFETDASIFRVFGVGGKIDGGVEASGGYDSESCCGTCDAGKRLVTSLTSL